MRDSDKERGSREYLWQMIFWLVTLLGVVVFMCTGNPNELYGL